MRDYEKPTRETIRKGKQRRCKRHTAKKKQGHKKEIRKASKIEILVGDYLQSLGVKFVREKTFHECNSVLHPDQPLPFDLYLIDFRACIELNGKQHYQIIDTDPDELRFERRKLNDNTRRLFCLKKGIPLLVMKYHHFNKFKPVIDEFIRSLIVTSRSY